MSAANAYAVKKPRPLNAQELMDYALKSLGARAQSQGELRQKLIRRAAEVPDVDEVLAKCKEAGYLNDRQYAETFANGRRDNEGFGKMRVLRDLRERRVAPKLAEEAVRTAFESTDETQMIEEFLRRKYRSRPLPEMLSEEKGMASVYRRLRYAGFSAGASIRVLKRYSALAEAIDEDQAEEPDAQ